MRHRHSLIPFAFLLFLLVLSTWSLPLVAQTAWLRDDLQLRTFIENEGQFNDRLPGKPIEFGYEGEGHHVFLGGNKVWFNIYKAKPHDKTPEEKRLRDLRKKMGFDSEEAFMAFEKSGKRIDFTTELLTAEWLGANPALALVPAEMDAFTHSYEYYEGRRLRNRTGVHSYRKVVLKDLYPHIDAEYTLHPVSGIKYSLILHPGADLSQVRLRYSGDPALRADGSIVTPTRLGDVLDHPPHTFYQGSGTVIPSAYVVNGDEISFQLGNYDPSRTVVIDPWTDLPNDPGSNWNCAWECETDALGNSYAIFGAMPMRLRKYNTAGAIQWTYNTTYDTTAWLGTFVTDDAGNSYVTNGSVAAIRKVSPAGGLIWSQGNITGQLLGEFWNIAFNCDQSRLVIGGTGGFLIPEPYIFDVDINTGNQLGALNIHGGSSLFDPQEVRAITATENARYYWMTHDSIGYVSNSFSNCPNPGSELVADNTYSLGYKCENWRYNNTGIEAIAYFGGFVFVNRGNRIDKRNFATAAIVTTAPIPGGGYNTPFGGSQVLNSGIVISNAGRIFVGSRGSVSEFDQNLNLIGTYPVTGAYNVYDVDITSDGQVIACGATGTSGTSARTGTVESLGVLAVGPYAMPCCDAAICQQGPLCDTDAPVTLTPTSGGGSWSTTAPGFNTTTGVFDPSVAGPGTYTFYYSLACGMDSLVITVSACASLSICVQSNGDLTVTGGAGPYTWESGTMVTSCPFGPGTGCNFLTHAVNTLTWTNIGSGGTITPPPGSDTVRVSDPSLGFTSWNISSLPPCGVLPMELTVFRGESVGEGENLLSWVTASESNVRNYTIQSSPTGQLWRPLASVPATGTSQEESTYSVKDPRAYAPLTYYRLGATDMDGSYRYLSTIAVQSGGANTFVDELYPNPATGTVGFRYIGAGNGAEVLRVEVLNELGQVVLEQSWNELRHSMSLEMNIGALPAGMYQVRFRQGSRSIVRKLAVLR